MQKQPRLTRRAAIGSGLAMGGWLAGGRTSPGLCAADARRRPRAQPLAQDFTVAARIPGPRYFINDPAVVILPDGALFMASPAVEYNGPGRQLLLVRSDDGGQSWQSVGSLPYGAGVPLVHDRRLYLLVYGEKERKSLVVLRSDNGGQTWTDPVAILDGRWWNLQTGMATVEGRLYWALTQGNHCVAIAGDLSGDLMDPRSWRASKPLPTPGFPPTLSRKMNPPKSWYREWGVDLWMEPNVVHVRGRTMVLLRTVIDEYATAGMCAVCDLADDGKTLDLRFTQFHPNPAGQHKFYILHDAPSRLYWMVGNQVTDPQDSQGNGPKLRKLRYVGGPGNERRILMLYYSIDALSWFQAGCVAMSARPLQSFMYPSAVVDGDDLLVTARTSRDGPTRPAAAVATFHRVRSFRSLALPLFPDI